jgi:hypothetical protein
MARWRHWREEVLSQLPDTLSGLDYCVRNQIKLLSIPDGLGLAKTGLCHASMSGGKGCSLLPGLKTQLLASFPYPSSIFSTWKLMSLGPATIHCSLAVNTELEMGWGCVGGI